MNDDNNDEQPHASRPFAIVTSGESDHDNDNDDNDDNDDNEPQSLFPPVETQPDDLYDPDVDEIDEAFVYQTLRGGVTETVRVQTPVAANSNSNSPSAKRLQALKPRHSDAVLQCPCCFEIVCMDCQQHDKYENQFRAMFVMNVAVHWDHVLQYCQTAQGLVRVGPEPASTSIPTETETPSTQTQTQAAVANSVEHVPPVSSKNDKEEYYYQTVCANCQTQVAALDMNDEVYHFYGCLPSA